MRRVCKEVNGPIMYNQTGISPRFSEEEMNELGIAMTILPGATMRMQLMAVYDLAMELKETGPLAEAEFTKKLSNHPLGDFHTFAGFDQVWIGNSASWARRSWRNTKARSAISQLRNSGLTVAPRQERHPRAPCHRRLERSVAPLHRSMRNNPAGYRETAAMRAGRTGWRTA